MFNKVSLIYGAISKPDSFQLALLNASLISYSKVSLEPSVTSLYRRYVCSFLCTHIMHVHVGCSFFVYAGELYCLTVIINGKCQLYSEA